MSGKERLKQIDPGTGLTLEELIDAFITDPREAKRLKAYLSRSKYICPGTTQRRKSDA